LAKEHDKAKDNGAPAGTSEVATTPKPHCGIVMPISEIDGCPASHWAEVKSILIEAIDAAGFTAELVSEAEDVGTIHKRIIQHLHDDPIVVCDVSGKNANVMFELGLRLAFDKPTIIVKDDKTGYSFDTSPIEHLTYPRDLRFAKIVDFKKDLAKKVAATFEAGKKPDYSTFLKHFGTFTVAKLETMEVSKDQYMLEQLSEIRTAVRALSVDRERERDRHHSLFSDESSNERALRWISDAMVRGIIPRLDPGDLETFMGRVRQRLRKLRIDEDDSIRFVNSEFQRFVADQAEKAK
jgi:hypothetical protein